MGIRDRYHLFDQRGKKMCSVIPNCKDGKHRVHGVIKTPYGNAKWYVDDQELEKFIKEEGLKREHQTNLFDYL
ncbi:hypothetical protein [Staphylococcus auricularis]|uniref:hypothetical protein n=1 Tax=Staphylococcus auricularis TaxID=29379 RepID=UPI00242DA11B|nr:hypothetical protein [Staphylococcus auricularis]